MFYQIIQIASKKKNETDKKDNKSGAILSEAELSEVIKNVKVDGFEPQEQEEPEEQTSPKKKCMIF